MNWFWWALGALYCVASYWYLIWCHKHDAGLKGKRWQDEIAPATILAPLFAPVVFINMLAVMRAKEQKPQHVVYPLCQGYCGYTNSDNPDDPDGLCLLCRGDREAEERMRAEDNEQMVRQAREVIQEWANKQGHDRCWWFPELFAKLADIFDIDPQVKPCKPPLAEALAGCKNYWERVEYPPMEFRPHCPGFVNDGEAAEGPCHIHDVAELREVPQVKRFLDEGAELSISPSELDTLLMANMPDGKHWVVGYLPPDAKIDLPRWKKPDAAEQV